MQTSVVSNLSLIYAPKIDRVMTACVDSAWAVFVGHIQSWGKPSKRYAGCYWAWRTGRKIGLSVQNCISHVTSVALKAPHGIRSISRSLRLAQHVHAANLFVYSKFLDEYVFQGVLSQTLICRCSFLSIVLFSFYIPLRTLTGVTGGDCWHKCQLIIAQFRMPQFSMHLLVLVLCCEALQMSKLKCPSFRIDRLTSVSKSRCRLQYFSHAHSSVVNYAVILP